MLVPLGRLVWILQAARVWNPSTPSYLFLVTDFLAELNINEEHSEGITWTTGGDLGISAGGLSIGGSVEVSESVSDAFGAGVTEPCPEGKWRCSAVITPSVMHVKGHLKLLGPDDGCEVSPTSRDDGGEDNKKFEFWIPIKDKSGNAKISIDVCTCQNRKNWADPGHPKLLCPEDCVDE